MEKAKILLVDDESDVTRILSKRLGRRGYECQTAANGQEAVDAMGQFAQQGGHALIAVLHDVNHALQHFERLLLIKDGKLMADVASSPDAADLLGQLYGVRFNTASNAAGQTVLIAQRRTAAAQAETTSTNLETEAACA